MRRAVGGLALVAALWVAARATAQVPAEADAPSETEAPAEAGPADPSAPGAPEAEGAPPDAPVRPSLPERPAAVPGAVSFDDALAALHLEAELETVQMNPLFFFGGGFVTVGGVVGVASSVQWLSEQDDAGPVALLVTTGVVAAVGLVLVVLGVVDKLEVDARRDALEARRDALGVPATGMFRVGLGAGGELRIR
ncbi:MAG TPA: hypothetical protein RMH99_27105 [Sandaracinaceae bacterium LLY-WYZ-13_1]|nr:hypothetical protein [Sandaracinaceae bacterium LLY-WYZ-13_1]